MFFDQVETEGPASPLLIDVRHSTHQWAKDHLSVVLEKVDLEKVSGNYVMIVFILQFTTRITETSITNPTRITN